jgi:hypothetical protein
MSSRTKLAEWPFFFRSRTHLAPASLLVLSFRLAANRFVGVFILTCSLFVRSIYLFVKGARYPTLGKSLASFAKGPGDF